MCNEVLSVIGVVALGLLGLVIVGGILQFAYFIKDLKDDVKNLDRCMNNRMDEITDLQIEIAQLKEKPTRKLGSKE